MPVMNDPQNFFVSKFVVVIVVTQHLASSETRQYQQNPLNFFVNNAMKVDSLMQKRISEQQND